MARQGMRVRLKRVSLDILFALIYPPTYVKLR